MRSRFNLGLITVANKIRINSELYFTFNIYTICRVVTKRIIKKLYFHTSIMTDPIIKSLTLCNTIFVIKKLQSRMVKKDVRAALKNEN